MNEQALGARTERAVKWSAITTAARFALQLGAQVALARLLGPGNYGIYGIGIAVLTFVSFLAGTGFSYSLMLQPQINDQDIRLAFTWQVLAGSTCALAMWLAAPWLAAYFREPGVTSMLRWLALACLLTSASGTSLCLLQRELDFRALGLIQLAAYALGYLAVGLPLALAGWGADALALACVVQAAVSLCGCWWRRPHPLRPLLGHAGGQFALLTGRTVFFTNLVNWLLANLDRLVIGRLLTTQAVGLYTLAWNLAQIPVTLLVGAVQPAFLASGAKMAHEQRRLAQAWRYMLASVFVLVLPAAVSMALIAPDLVRLVYGPHWRDAGWVLALMFLGLPAWASWGLSTPVLWNTQRKDMEARLQWPLLLLVVPAWCWAAPRGLLWAAGVSLLAVHARAILVVGAGLRALGLRWTRLLPLLARGSLLSIACGGGTLAAQAASRLLPLPEVQATALCLAAGTGGALLTGLMLAWTLPTLLGDEAYETLSRLLPFLRSSQAVTAPLEPKQS